mmetsp:Transcript_26234/g.69912  ORF Transcript_26234/g.69912 Transcript_26234/m.69912 type:complete len:94 (-) Transcript_26234:326-607(-)
MFIYAVAGLVYCILHGFPEGVLLFFLMSVSAFVIALGPLCIFRCLEMRTRRRRVEVAYKLGYKDEDDLALQLTEQGSPMFEDAGEEEDEVKSD